MTDGDGPLPQIKIWILTVSTRVCTDAHVLKLEDEKDPEILRKAALLFRSHNRVLTKKVTDLARENAELRGDSAAVQLKLKTLEEQLAKLTREVFGKSSEKRAEPEAGRAGGEAGDAQKPKPETKPPQRGHGPKAQPKLPCVDVVHDLDEADKTCPQCGGGLEEMVGQYEEHEEIDVVPLRFVRKRHLRKKYRCSCSACIETAPGPDKLRAGNRYSINFAIFVATSKYADHLPLERQVRMMARDGLVVTSQTLWDQIEMLERLVASVHPRLLEYLRSKPLLGADETTWNLFGAKPGQGKSWFVWVVQAENAVFYALRGSREHKIAIELLAAYKGKVMCDGYDAYVTLAAQCPGIVLLHCWAHVRRKFIDIESFFPQECGEIVGLVRKLYAIEKKCPRADVDKRRELRDRESRKIIDEIVAWVWQTLPTCLPESGLRKAIGYMIHMWAGLVLFLDDPTIPLDNNAAERAARGPVVGRKNHYGSRSVRGTEVAATFYSLIESAKLNGIDPRFYLRVAVHASQRGHPVPLPHELKQMLIDDAIDPADYDDDTAGIVAAAMMALRSTVATVTTDDAAVSAARSES